MTVGALIDAATRAFHSRLEGAVGGLASAQDAASFCGAERLVFALAQQFATQLVEGALQQACESLEHRELAIGQVRERAARRGIQVELAGSRSTRVRTLSGDFIQVVTPYAKARPRGRGQAATRGAQGTGVYPVLDLLGISGRSTPALRLLVSRAVCEANSVTSARELLAMAGTELDHKAALRLTYMVCDDALRARQAALAAGEINDDGAFAGRRVVVTVDGGRVNVRRRVPGRPRKGGRKRFVTEWREPKILTLYVLDDNGRRDRSVASVVDGTLGAAGDVFELITYYLFKYGGHRAQDVTLVGDGAKWIWARGEALREALGLPPERFHEIVDYFHVVERLGTFSKSQTKWSELKQKRWLVEQRRRLKAGDVEAIEAEFAGLRKRERRKEQRKALDTELAYWDRNRARLRFRQFREAGLPNGSGAVESSVRRVINLRLKGASISWTEEHAEGVIHLRAHAKSGRWPELEAAVLQTTGWRPTARQPRSAA
jgi:hypothetical protein